MNDRKSFSTVISNWRKLSVVELSRAWSGIKNFTRRTFTDSLHPDLPPKDAEKLLRQIKDCLETSDGGASSQAHAVEIGSQYFELSTEGRKKFLKILAENFDVDRKKVESAIAKYTGAISDTDLFKGEIALKEALTPPRLTLLKQFNALPQGFKFLIDLRADILPMKKESVPLSKLESDLKEILASWFDVGLLDLREITWNSSASLLEKLIKYEAVHAISSWQDLKDRLDSDRRCYAFFHNKIDQEPLIFVEVALVDKLADSIQKVLDQEVTPLNVKDANTAIFYSISNTQKGLAGISLGNFLIKDVVEKVSTDIPNIKNFATLSPIPGFRSWLDKKLGTEDADKFLEPVKKEIKTVLPEGKKGAKGLSEFIGSAEFVKQPQTEPLSIILKHLCAYYILKEKRDGKALDPVANFHLTNGARAERINIMADISPKGVKESYGIMINYLYKLSDIEENHE
ncbi:MAG: malonyl-CoA decarboxylase, partial [Fibrobacteres bacterium]|nr:malonyl-CoA decarboxylase [Fibrobacterota bacterium]